jgi:DNA modification methylase
MTEKHANLELWKSAPLAEINHPHPKNPRVIPDADSEEVRTLDASLEHDYFDPLIWNKRNRMWVSGHVRAWRMTALGFTHADVVVVDYDEETHLARMLAANAHSGKNDEDKLDALLASLRDASVDPVLALLSALPPAPPPPVGDADAEPDLDRAAELNKIWQVETGQIWQIGPHRLMCGSSTEATDAARLLNGAKPRLMITDPPYGVEYDPDWRLEAGINKPGQILASGKVMNDDICDWTGAWQLSPSSVCYIWHAGRYAGTVQTSMETAGFTTRSQIIWAKPSLVMGRGNYHWQHEPCWYGVRKNATAEWIGDRKQTSLWQIANMHRTQGDVDDGKTVHSTQKPVECMARPMRNHSGDVHDPFLGSGTTMVAAQNLHRICYGMELSPDYCAVILDRMQRAFPDLEIKRVA